MRYLKRVAVLAVTVVALLVPSTSATAAPAPGFEEFTGCATKSVDPDITACFTSVVSSGNLKLGSKNTPITDPITLTGALKPDEATGGTVVAPVFDGGRQIVPGGLVGLTGIESLAWLFPVSLLQLYAEAELAGTPGNPLNQTFPLPLKVKLEAAILSNTCYVGSNSNPINLNLYQADPGQVTVGPEILRVNGLVLTDNTFAAPAASGCGILGIGLVDTLVNAQAGLPAATGNNTTQNADAALAAVESVYPPSGF